MEDSSFLLSRQECTKEQLHEAVDQYFKGTLDVHWLLNGPAGDVFALLSAIPLLMVIDLEEGLVSFSKLIDFMEDSLARVKRLSSEYYEQGQKPEEN